MIAIGIILVLTGLLWIAVAGAVFGFWKVLEIRAEPLDLKRDSLGGVILVALIGPALVAWGALLIRGS